MKRLLGLAAVLLFCATGADSPQFRGERAAGVSQEAGLPTTWSDDENIVWRAPLPGYGASSPVTLGDRIILTGYSGYGTGNTEDADPSDLRRHVTCIDGTKGEVIWDTTIASQPGDRSYRGFVALHGYASATPVTDGEAIYAYFGKSGAVAVDLNGKLLWKADCGDRTHSFGSGASPVLYDDLLIVNASVESGCLIALNKKTGDQVWQSGKVNAAWNTPLLVEVDGRRELVISMKGKVQAYDPETGEPLWHCDGIPDYVCPSAIAHDGVVYAIGGRAHVGLAVRAGGSGDVTDSHRLYQLKRGSNVSSPVYHDGRLYWAHERSGIVYCASAETGEVIYEERLQPRPGRIYASPLVADGKIYYVSRENGAYVLAAGDEFKLLAHNEFASDRSVFNASPVALDGKLLLRSDENLYCIGE